MRPKCLRHIGTAAGDLDDADSTSRMLAAGPAVLRRNTQAEHAGVPDRLDRVVLQHRSARRRVLAPQALDDLG